MLQNQVCRALIVLAILAAVPSLAAAELHSAGNISLGPAVSGKDYGAGGIVDIWAAFGPFRVGGALGMAAITSSDGVSSRVFTPVAASLAYVLTSSSGMGFDLRLRGGAWAGATDFGLQGGGFGSVGGWLTFALSSHVAAGLGLEAWFQSHVSGHVTWMPGVSLAWLPGA